MVGMLMFANLALGIVPGCTADEHLCCRFSDHLGGGVDRHSGNTANAGSTLYCPDGAFHSNLSRASSHANHTNWLRIA